MTNYLSHNLLFLRKSFNLSQEQLGNIVGKTHSAVSRWEKDEREPSFSDIKKIAEYFGVTPADLMYRQLGAPSSVGGETTYLIELINISKDFNRSQIERLLAYAKGLKDAGL